MIAVGWCLLAAISAPEGAHAQPPAIPGPRLGGYLQVRGTFAEPIGWSATLNRVRLSADGQLPNRLAYRTLVEFQAGATARTPALVSLREAIIRWSLAPWSAQTGQFKTPFSREYLIPVSALETADFSAVVDTLAPKYDIGVMGECTVPFLTVSAGVFNGEGQNAGLNRDSTILSVARASLRPIPQITVAGHLARYSADSTRYGGDVSLEQSGLLVRAEFLGQRKSGRSRDDIGWYVLAGCRVLPWLQLVAKQEDFQRPGIGLARRISATTGGATVELPGGRTRLLVNLVSRRTGFPRVTRNSFISQLQVRF